MNAAGVNARPPRANRSRTVLPPVRFPRHGFGGTGAFTLMELIVVVVIIGIMTVAIVAEMKGTFEDALLRSSARKVVGAASLAHSQSVTAYRPHRLLFDTATGRYRIEEWRSDPDGEGHGFRAIPHLPGAEGDLDPRISLEIRKAGEESDAAELNRPQLTTEPPGSASAPLTVLFQPDGTAERAEIHLRDRTGAGLALRLNPMTSRIRISNLEREHP